MAGLVCGSLGARRDRSERKRVFFTAGGGARRMTMPEKETRGDIEQITKKKLMEDLKTVVTDAEELLKKAASDQTREWLATAQAKAKKSLKAANDWLAEEEAAVTAKARATEDYVRANAWMVLGMAVMTGVAVGILAGRLGQSVIEEGKRLVTQGVRILTNGKTLKENGEAP
jgi:ElaB/YqjD/DUF883 family membrane-anchored ribosome-binding protein